MVELDIALLLVSHNRYQLDAVTSRIVELANGRATSFAGNYSSYRATKLRNAIAQQSDYLANQKRLASLEELVKRFEQYARATGDPKWGKRLRARRSQLAREQRDAIEEPTLGDRAMHLELAGNAPRADIALRIAGYHRAFDNLVLFDEAALDITVGERVALVGPNGSGKTTLLRDVVAEGNWDSDTIRIRPSIRLGYCPQKHEVLDPDKTVIDTLRDLAPLSRDRAYAVLSQFLLSWESMDQRVGELSGGERSRLQLARLMVLEPNLLILHEPTNHLDVASREAVEEGLESFEGTLLVVSHDRYLLERIVERVVWIEGHRLHDFPGTFSEFWLSQAGAEPPPRDRSKT